MIATATKTTFMNIAIDGVDFGDFKLESKWEGLVLLQNGNLKIIAEEPKETLFSEIFVGSLAPQPMPMPIIKASPEIIEALNRAASPAK